MNSEIEFPDCFRQEYRNKYSIFTRQLRIFPSLINVPGFHLYPIQQAKRIQNYLWFHKTNSSFYCKQNAGSGEGGIKVQRKQIY